MEKENTTVAVWESRGHKYRVELYRGNIGWSYREFTNGRPCGFGCWPALGLGRDNEARYGFVNFGRRLRAGSFQADANAAPMVRIAAKGGAV